MLLEEENLVVSENYKKHPIAKEIGFLTYQYLKLYNFHSNERIAQLNNYEDVLNFDRENNFIDLIIFNESIHKDLIHNATLIGSTNDEMEELLNKRFHKKVNASQRNNDYQTYYDEETIELVRKKDRLIIEKYDYHFD